MKIYLENDCVFELLVGKGAPLTLPKGMYIDTIRWDYLPDHIKEQLDEWQTKSIKEGKTFIIYIKQKYYCTSRDLKTTKLGWF